MTSLKVDNLSYKITSEDLKPLFEKYGDVGDIYIPRDRFTKKSRGFSFVRFYDKRDAEEAMDRMNGYMLDGREMRVQLAKYGRPSEPRYNKSYGQSRRSDRGRSRSRSRDRSRSPRRRHSKSRSRTPPRKPRRHSDSPVRDRARSKERDTRKAKNSPSRSRSSSRSADKVDIKADKSSKNNSRPIEKDEGKRQQRTKDKSYSPAPPKDRSISASPTNGDNRDTKSPTD
eukprot:Em0005g1210a